MNLMKRFMTVFAFAVLALLGGVFASQLAPQAVQAAPLPAFAPQVAVTVLPAVCGSVANFDATYTKVKDIGTFTAQSGQSMTELTFQGRLGVNTMAGGTNGARFQLYVDDLPSNVGNARALVRSSEVGAPGVPTTFSAFFSDLAGGDHMVSLWVQATNNSSGTGAGIDPGCFSISSVIVKESLPFGSSYLPNIFNADAP